MAFQFGVFIASGVILFCTEKLGIKDWTASFRGWLIGAFVVSGGILLSYVGSGIYPWVAAYAKDTRIMSLGKRHLNQLTPDEKEICKHFVEKQR